MNIPQATVEKSTPWLQKSYVSNQDPRTGIWLGGSNNYLSRGKASKKLNEKEQQWIQS